MPAASRKGVEYWADAGAETGAGHTAFVATVVKRLLAMDARNGALCADFGDAGIVDVEPYIKAMVLADGVIGTQLLSPPTAINGVIAVASTSNKFQRDSVNGAIRGFDARTGELR